ncbi:MAG: hypothetical protein Q8922_10670 [Bacteroidota bacterium]|nr:hypothetical protein [Bacteroidota bacterium]MDP4233015.1 hypothetical protein [Bacteroidota bacterium]MDP4241840.1 hypothetical protein [Bacteroidota bacterium]MDP4288389.1 hypothetical protein [Bacteroidota bacterium]
MKHIGIVLGLFCAIAMTTGTLRATTHVISFGGKLHNKYTPASLTVAVGDTILWQGDFEDHPLTLTKAPSGAATFEHIEKGKLFRYIVTVAGNYTYECDKHSDQGMTGSFIADPPAAKID